MVLCAKCLAADYEDYRVGNSVRSVAMCLFVCEKLHFTSSVGMLTCTNSCLTESNSIPDFESSVYKGPELCNLIHIFVYMYFE